MSKFFTVLIGSLIALVAITACGGVPFIAQNEPTATRRAARPTFTPRAPRATPTEELEPTAEIEPTEAPEATAEPEPTEPPVQPTAVPVTVAPTRPPQPAAPTEPPAPAQPPAPTFSVSTTDKFLCEQDGIFEIAVSVKQGRANIEGIYFAAFAPDGRLLLDGADKPLVTATYPVSVSTAGNCKLSGSFDSPVINNGKLDLVDAVRREGNASVIIRFVKSETDLTPISADIPVSFGNGGRFWIYTQMQ